MAFQRKKPAAIGAKANYPGFIEPALASSIERVPSGKRWVHEINFEGYRVQVHLANESIKVFTRRGNDWTKRFRKIADDAWHISAGSAVIERKALLKKLVAGIAVQFSESFEIAGQEMFNRPSYGRLDAPWRRIDAVNP